MSIDSKFIALLIITNIICGVLGYIIGVLNNTPKQVYNSSKYQKKSNNISDIEQINNRVTINEKKVVLSSKIDDLEKKYENLGEVKESNDNIINSVNKLKNIKK